MITIKKSLKKYVFSFLLLIMATTLLPRQAMFMNMQKLVFYYSRNTNEYYLAATSTDEDTRCGPFDTYSAHVLLEMRNGEKITIRNKNLKIVCLGTLYNEVLARNTTLFRFNIVIDNSGSIDDRNLAFVQDTLSRFIRNVPPVYEAQIIKFADNIQIHSSFLKDKQALIRYINEPKHRGNTALFDAITLGVEGLIDPEFKIPLRFTVVLTDGKDNRSKISREDFKPKIIRMCRDNHIPLFIVGVTDEVDSQLLKDISRYGMYQHIKRFPDVDKAFALILNVIKDTYIIKIPARGEFSELKTIYLVKEPRPGKFETIQDFIIQ